MRHIFLLAFTLYFVNMQAKFVNKVDPKLIEKASETNQDIVIILKKQADISAVKAIKSKDAKATYVYHQLYKKAKETQTEIIEILNENKIRFRSYYIVNMISASCKMEMIKKLSLRNDVECIIEDGKFTMLPTPERDINQQSDRAPVWGINKIGAPSVWAMGYNGQGVVIGGQDTGYAWEVNTIKNKYRGWNGTSANHDYNWHDAIHQNQSSNPCGIDSPEPCDDHNHGTHTMGTMVGDTDNDGNDIGVAPGAKWIGCRNMDAGNGKLSTYIECFEWFLAPYPVAGGLGDPTKMPHVINNSWGCPPSEDCNTTNFQVMEAAINILRNAGCVVVVSAGNSGPNCNSVNDPAAIFEGSFSVGSTDNSDGIAVHSSRGAVLVDGSFRLKPNVTAPGVNVRSCLKDGSFANFSGTSMAGPHVAGLVALMISANPNLAGEVELIEDIIEQTAFRLTSNQNCNGTNGSTIPNNTFGFGRIDAVAAVNRALNELYVPFIKVDQFGYLPSSQKIAVISNPVYGYNNTSSYTVPATMVVKNSKNHQVVFSASPTAWNNGAIHDQSGDQVWWFDFSSVTTPGTYHIAGFPDGGYRSEDFEISSSIYEDVVKAVFKAFYYQRCGTAKSTPYVDSEYEDAACHTQDINCRFINDPVNAALFKNMSGGWHDAGDYNKYVNFAYKPVLDLLWSYEMKPEAWQSDELNIPESGNGIPDLLDEIKFELDWLLKMQDIDGGVFCVVGVQNFASASPPSADNATRYYGPKTTTASLSTAAMFAFAAKQFFKIDHPTAQNYAATLQTKAIAAWNWAQANPNITYYNASNNLAAGEQETDNYEREMRRIAAAIYLYDLTEDNIYKDYVQSFYASSHMFQWGFVYPFENVIQLSLMHFSQLKGVSSGVANAIRNAFKTSMDNHADNFPAYSNNTDAYRAFLKTDNITWGSNETKCNQGSLYQEYTFFNLDSNKNQTADNIIGGYLHYLHGVNPNGLAYLTNMYNLGASRSVNSIYHSWFVDGSSNWDDVRTSTYGPAPGFIPGGANPYWALDPCCPNGCGGQNNSLCIMLTPPADQPALKAYYDWNTGYPQNSWTITEPAIYTQAAYLKLASDKIQPTLTGVEQGKQIQFSTDTYFTSSGRSIVLTSANGTHYRIIVDNAGKVGTMVVANIPLGSTHVKEAYLNTTEAQKGHIIHAPDNSLWKVFVNNSGYLVAESTTVPSNNYISSLNGDIVVTDAGFGWITKDQDGVCYLITVSDTGRIMSKPILCD